MSNWQKGDMPEDGSVIYVREVHVYRFKLYKPNSDQYRKGVKGRWQKMDEYGGWDNCSPPDMLEWCEDFND